MSDDGGLDLFATEPREPGFPVHEVTVTRVAYDDPPTSLGIDPSELEYEIDHGKCDARGEECIVEGSIRELGMHQAMFGVWDKDNRLEEKTYRLRGWVSKSPATPNGPEEWDAGIEEVGTSTLVTEIPEGSLVIDSLTAVQEGLMKQTIERASKPDLGPEHQPGWVPDPEWDRKMEAENPSWCVEHDRWKVECGGLHDE